MQYNGGNKATKDDDYDRYGFAGGKSVEDGILDLDVVVEKSDEKNAPSDMATVSGYVFYPDIFNYLDEVLENLEAGEEFYYNDNSEIDVKRWQKNSSCGN